MNFHKILTLNGKLMIVLHCAASNEIQKGPFLKIFIKMFLT